jgi:hypothetical protein
MEIGNESRQIDWPLPRLLTNESLSCDPTTLSSSGHHAYPDQMGQGRWQTKRSLKLACSGVNEPQIAGSIGPLTKMIPEWSAIRFFW